MINILTEIIKKNPNWLTCPGSELSFMKVSTPASGKELNRGKVLIFVFEKNEIFPTLCVKTARTYSGGEIIKLNFSHLQLLTDSLVNTAHKDLFAKPLHIYDDNKIIFSIESACQGEMFSSQNKSIASVFEKYTQWQESLTNSTARTLRIQDLNKIATDFIDALLCSEETKTELSNYYKSFALDPETELPELLQHGDMTPDNVLVNGENIHIVDYDYVGLSRIPGFDLFHFFSKARKNGGTLREFCAQYLPNYFSRVGGTVTKLEPILFIYYIQESLRKGVGTKTGKEIIENFNYLLDRK